MHRTTTKAMAAAAAVAAVFAAAGGALGAPSAAWPARPGWGAAAEPVQYHSDWRGPKDVEEHRWLHRQRVRAYEEQRAAEAARRKTVRAEKEVSERRSWPHALRERHGRPGGS